MIELEIDGIAMRVGRGADAKTVAAVIRGTEGDVVIGPTASARLRHIISLDTPASRTAFRLPWSCWALRHRFRQAATPAGANRDYDAVASA
ncbi:hypothetical protein GCM10010869_49320 [Mesorhizobium tianshanense]|uniref:hypothetical protein n=1 Tax=Mesorhizobium tianshanense TaxID=39844 RepID=UPI00119F6A31|nr:hypothetical protein [Mesorhizobium tianshanense]GLS39335.1 hypothetical protein GCM10010869_49320 [Mesorhizobium tianshanense]